MNASVGTTPNVFLYAGKIGYYFAIDSRSYYLRNRYLAAISGTFFSRDKRPPNGYSYACNNPVAVVDPSGNSIVVVLPVFIVGYCIIQTVLCSKRRDDFYKSQGGTKPSAGQQKCIDTAISVLNVAVPMAGHQGQGLWDQCAESIAGVAPLGAFDYAVTGVICNCQPLTLLNPGITKCDSCSD